MPKTYSRWQTLLRSGICAFVISWLANLGSATESLDPTQFKSFSRNVTAAFDKAGCNLGACHGNQRGKGGFHLSLRGEDPTEDFKNLVQAEFGRRIDRLTPEQSLILLKGKGGRRPRRREAFQRICTNLPSVAGVAETGGTCTCFSR